MNDTQTCQLPQSGVGSSWITESGAPARPAEKPSGEQPDWANWLTLAVVALIGYWLLSDGKEKA